MPYRTAQILGISAKSFECKEKFVKLKTYHQSYPQESGIGFLLLTVAQKMQQK